MCRRIRDEISRKVKSLVELFEGIFMVILLPYGGVSHEPLIQGSDGKSVIVVEMKDRPFSVHATCCAQNYNVDYGFQDNNWL